VLVDVLLVVGDDGFGNGLADGVDLRDVATARDADADVDIGCDYCQTYFSSPVIWVLCAYRTCQRRGLGRARRP